MIVIKTICVDINETGKSLLECLIDQGYYIAAYCGGKGSCGKCKVRFLSDAPGPLVADQACLSQKDIEEGWRLACKVMISEPSHVILELDAPEDDQMIAESGFKLGKDHEEIINTKSAGEAHALKTVREEGISSYIMCVDLGTTTIAASLLNATTGIVEATRTCVNHQRMYGADVISRIQASSVEGKKEELKECVEKDIEALKEELFSQVIPSHNISSKEQSHAQIQNAILQDQNQQQDQTIILQDQNPEQSQSVESEFEILPELPIIISGNTTMEHLLQGFDCATLGRYPFTPVDISLHDYKNMTILPGISTYVGADIVSGIIACDIDQKEEISILVDLGTNGEMLIGNKHKILATSTAAGPAFEGGNILHGVAGIPGAIDSLTIHNGRACAHTIGGEKAIGICGSGVVEAVYELLNEEIIDETGRMEEVYFKSGFPLAEGITFTQKDVREVQMAKAAIRAGIEILIESYGIDYEQVAHLYLAGGFGQKINVHKAVGIGMIPSELEDKIIAVGNSSLAGAVMYAQNPALAERFCQVAGMSEEINLSKHKKFNTYYIDYMYFEEEE